MALYCYHGMVESDLPNHIVFLDNVHYEIWVELNLIVEGIIKISLDCSSYISFCGEIEEHMN